MNSPRPDRRCVSMRSGGFQPPAASAAGGMNVPRLRRGSAAGSRRYGVSLMVAIVLLAVTTGLLVEAARTAALARRGLAGAERAAAADLFADAAARLAHARAAADPSYPGETWAAETPLGSATATVAPDEGGGFVIDVELTDGGEAARARRAVGGVSSLDIPAARAPLTAPKP